MDASTSTNILGFWRIATADPDRPAIIDVDGTMMSFGQLLEHSRRVMTTLSSLGIGAGDHIALLLPNHRTFWEVLLGALENGVVVIPVNSHLAAAEESMTDESS